MSDGQLAIVGASLVGKTSLVQRLITGSFLHRPPTVGAEFAVRTISVQGIPAFIRIADCGGGGAYASLAERYIRTAPVVMAVYDLTRPETLNDALALVSPLLEAATPRQKCIALIAAKADATETLVRESAAVAAGRQAAADAGMLFFAVSAKTGAGVHEAFAGAVSEYARHRPGLLASPAGSGTHTPHKSSQGGSASPTSARRSFLSRQGSDSSVGVGPGDGSQSSPGRSLRLKKAPKLSPPVHASDMQALELTGSALPLPLETVENAPRIVGHSGILTKKGHIVPSWRTRLFLLRDSLLYYYDQKDPAAPKGVIVLGATTTVEQWPDEGIHKHCFRVCVSNAYTRNAEYVISAPDDAARGGWISAIGASIAHAAEAARMGDDTPDSPRASSQSEKRLAADALDGREPLRLAVEGDAVGFAPVPSGPQLPFAPRIRWYARGTTGLSAHLLSLGTADHEPKVLLASDGGTPVRLVIWPSVQRSKRPAQSQGHGTDGGDSGAVGEGYAAALRQLGEFLEEGGVRVTFPLGKDGALGAQAPSLHAATGPLARLMLECAHASYAAACRALYVQPMAEVVVDMAGAMSAGSALTTLSVATCTLSERDIRALLYPLRYYSSARAVSLRRCRVLPAALSLGMRTIATECLAVRSVDISGIGEASMDAQALAAICELAQVSRIDTLCVANNGWGDAEAGQLLAAVAARTQSMDTLDFSGNALGDGCCHALPRLLASAGCPSALIFEGTRFTATGCGHIVDALRAATGDTSGAEDGGDAPAAQGGAATTLAVPSQRSVAVGVRNLRRIDLDGTGLTPLQRRAIARALRFYGALGRSGGGSNQSLSTSTVSLSVAVEDMAATAGGDAPQSSLDVLSMSALTTRADVAMHVDLERAISSLEIDGRSLYAEWSPLDVGGAVAGEALAPRRFEAMTMEGAPAVVVVEPRVRLCLSSGQTEAVLCKDGDGRGVPRIRCDPNACSFVVARCGDFGQTSAFAASERDFADVCSSLAVYVTASATRGLRTPREIEDAIAHAMAQLLPSGQSSQGNNCAPSAFVVPAHATLAPEECLAAARALDTSTPAYRIDDGLFEVLRSVVGMAASVAQLARTAAQGGMEARTAALKIAMAEIGAQFGCACDALAGLAASSPFAVPVDVALCVRAALATIAECAASAAALVDGAIPSPAISASVAEFGAVAGRAAKLAVGTALGSHLLNNASLSDKACPDPSKAPSCGPSRSECPAPALTDMLALVPGPRTAARLGRGGSTLYGAWGCDVLSRATPASLPIAAGCVRSLGSSSPRASGAEADVASSFADCPAATQLSATTFASALAWHAHAAGAAALAEKSESLARYSLRTLRFAAVVALGRCEEDTTCARVAACGARTEPRELISDGDAVLACVANVIPLLGDALGIPRVTETTPSATDAAEVVSAMDDAVAHACVDGSAEAHDDDHECVEI